MLSGTFQLPKRHHLVISCVLHPPLATFTFYWQCRWNSMQNYVTIGMQPPTKLLGRLLTGVESELEMLRNLQGVSSRMKWPGKKKRWFSNDGCVSNAIWNDPMLYLVLPGGWLCNFECQSCLSSLWYFARHALQRLCRRQGLRRDVRQLVGQEVPRCRGLEPFSFWPWLSSELRSTGLQTCLRYIHLGTKPQMMIQYQKI